MAWKMWVGLVGMWMLTGCGPKIGVLVVDIYGQPIEDADPQLPWQEFCNEMIVKPLERP